MYILNFSSESENFYFLENTYIFDMVLLYLKWVYYITKTMIHIFFENLTKFLKHNLIKILNLLRYPVLKMVGVLRHLPSQADINWKVS